MLFGPHVARSKKCRNIENYHETDVKISVLILRHVKKLFKTLVNYMDAYILYAHTSVQDFRQCKVSKKLLAG